MSIFYKVSEGLTKPLAPQMNGETQMLNQRKLELDKELRRNRRNLYELAKSSREPNILSFVNN